MPYTTEILNSTKNILAELEGYYGDKRINDLLNAALKGHKQKDSFLADTLCDILEQELLTKRNNDMALMQKAIFDNFQKAGLNIDAIEFENENSQLPSDTLTQKQAHAHALFFNSLQELIKTLREYAIERKKEGC